MKKEKRLLSETHAKNKYLSGLINESEYDKLLQQIAKDFQASQDYEKERDEMYLSEGKTLKDVHAEKGKMHHILDIPEDEKVSDHYTSGKELADALMAKVKDQKKVTGMLAFAANKNKEEDVFDKALRAMKRIDESYGIDDEYFLS